MVTDFANSCPAAAESDARMTAITSSPETAVNETDENGDTNSESCGEQTKFSERFRNRSGVYGRQSTEARRSEPSSSQETDVKEDPDRLYMESDGVVYEIDDNAGMTYCRRIYILIKSPL